MTITKPDGTKLNIKLDKLSNSYEMQRIVLDDESYIEIEHFKVPERWDISWNQNIPDSKYNINTINVLDAISVTTEFKAVAWVNNLLKSIPCKIPD